jgi:hypothetical protein
MEDNPENDSGDDFEVDRVGKAALDAALKGDSAGSGYPWNAGEFDTGDLDPDSIEAIGRMDGTLPRFGRRKF